MTTSCLVPLPPQPNREPSAVLNWRNSAAHLRRCGMPLDLAILMLVVPMSTYELHDRIIVATAKSLGAALIGRDEGIRSAGTVPFAR